MNEKSGNDSVSEILEIKIDLPNNHLDVFCDFITENISNGLVLEDEIDLPDTTVIFYLQPDVADQKLELINEYLTKLSEIKMIPLPELRSRNINKITWEDEYKKNVQPVIIEDQIIVRPPWLPNADSCKYDIIIEPKMAFGTGKHETTRSCLKVMLEHFKKGNRFLDMGCGSGVLSILADQMGASYIKSIDYDVVAIENCKENLKFNKVSAPYDVLFGSIEKCNNDKPFDFVCSNIIKSTILEFIDQLVELTAVDGVLILSGLLEPDMDEINAALKRNNITDVTAYPDNEWRTLIVKKSS